MYGSDVFKNRCSLFLLHIPIDLLAILLIISYWKREIYSFSVILILANVYNVVSIILSGWRLCSEKDLEKRKILLKNEDLSITEVALECGFNSGSYYAELFKKYNGCTTRNFRKYKK